MADFEVSISKTLSIRGLTESVLLIDTSKSAIPYF
jgi:hypothetical protein